MYEQLVTRNADQPGNSCCFEHDPKLTGTVAGSPALEVIRVINANIIMHSNFDMMVVSYPVQMYNSYSIYNEENSMIYIAKMRGKYRSTEGGFGLPRFSEKLRTGDTMQHF